MKIRAAVLKDSLLLGFYGGRGYERLQTMRPKIYTTFITPQWNFQVSVLRHCCQSTSTAPWPFGPANINLGYKTV